MGKKINDTIEKPTIFFENNYTASDIVSFQEKNPHSIILDIVEEQYKELFTIYYPKEQSTDDGSRHLQDFLSERKNDVKHTGNWVYYPWKNTFIHTINEKEYTLLRTNRNRDIITLSEQKSLLDACVGFVGLSIGSHFAIGSSVSGIANMMKLADFDTISTSNLNRLSAGVLDIGLLKTQFVTRKIYENNPYAQLFPYTKKLDIPTLQHFLSDNPKPQVIFEAIDDFAMKIQLRIEARKAKIPVIMLTNLGDTILIDIERYDLNPTLPLFNGRIGMVPEEILKGKISKEDIVTYAVAIVGKENIPQRVRESLSQIHTTLVGRPQVYSTVITASGIGLYLLRQILLKKSTQSERIFIPFDRYIQGPHNNIV